MNTNKCKVCDNNIVICLYCHITKNKTSQYCDTNTKVAHFNLFSFDEDLRKILDIWIIIRDTSVMYGDNYGNNYNKYSDYKYARNKLFGLKSLMVFLIFCF